MVLDLRRRLRAPCGSAWVSAHASRGSAPAPRCARTIPFPRMMDAPSARDLTLCDPALERRSHVLRAASSPELSCLLLAFPALAAAEKYTPRSARRRAARAAQPAGGGAEVLWGRASSSAREGRPRRLPALIKRPEGRKRRARREVQDDTGCARGEGPLSENVEPAPAVDAMKADSACVERQRLGVSTSGSSSRS